jgi:hypothetical protein
MANKPEWMPKSIFNDDLNQNPLVSIREENDFALVGADDIRRAIRSLEVSEKIKEGLEKITK